MEALTILSFVHFALERKITEIAGYTHENSHIWYQTKLACEMSSIQCTYFVRYDTIFLS
jgi:hypothetical protein